MLYQLSYAHHPGKIITRRRVRELRLAREGNWRKALAAHGALAQMGARLLRPCAIGRMAKIEDPLFAGETALAALFVGESQIEVDVGVGGQRPDGAPQMFDGLVQLSLLLEDAAKVVTRDSVQGIELNGGKKFGARFLGPAQSDRARHPD